MKCIRGIEHHDGRCMQIEDSPGLDEVTLTRKFGNEECVSELHTIILEPTELVKDVNINHAPGTCQGSFPYHINLPSLASYP